MTGEPGAPGAGESAPPAGPEVLASLLDLAHDLAEARSEEELCAAVARALDALVPGRVHAIRLCDPHGFALTTVRASRPLPEGPPRLVLPRAALAGTGLDPGPLEAAGLLLAEGAPPLLGPGRAARSVPLVVAGALHGVIEVEVPAGEREPGAGPGPVLHQVAYQAALAARNLRSLEEVAALKRSLEDLVEHANALITMTDQRRQVTVWNGALARLTGVPRGEALRRDLGRFATAADAPRFDALLDRTLAGEAVDGHEACLEVRGGGEARVTFNTAPVLGPGGAVVGVVAIGQDLTRLHHLEAAAEQAEKMAGLGRLAAGIVHELNNPLTAVTMYAEALHEKWSNLGGSADLEKIATIRDAGQRIQRLTRDLTAYARPGGGQPELVELAPLLEQAIRMCKPALKEAGAQVVKELEPVPQVEASRAGLVQCFVNLIANAAQALRGGGTVRLGLRQAGEQVLVTVGDDGAGMTPEVLARAFEPFFTTRAGRGIGLGLGTARGIVERHGGTIGLESAPGRGTTVTVSLPRQRSAP